MDQFNGNVKTLTNNKTKQNQYYMKAISTKLKAISTKFEQEIQNSEIKYPILMKSNFTELVVLFTDICSGMVMIDASRNYKFGYTYTEWTPATDAEVWHPIEIKL